MLIVSGDTITMKDFPTCSGEKQILTNQFQRRVSDEQFSDAPIPDTNLKVWFRENTRKQRRSKQKWATFFRRYWSGDIYGEQHQINIWATNETSSLMRYNSHTFFGGTFRSAPRPFYHRIIVMVYDIGTEIYVPTVNALVTCKKEYIYS
ncbi:hypothetical protein HZS_1211 [Henneguya salminicola]|nr:hypothetical protein HZS_1211 [Henneguya salminicola]